MKKRVLAFLLAAAMLSATACGTTSKPAESKPAETPAASTTTPSTTEKKEEPKKEEVKAEDENSIDDIVYAYLSSEEVTSFVPQLTHTGSDARVLHPLYDALLTKNAFGQMAPCLAEEWNTPDGGKTWIFKLRDGVKWSDINGEVKADLNGDDFACATELSLNYHKCGGSSSTKLLKMLDGAQAYYDYTKSLSPEEGMALGYGADSKFAEMTGFEVSDDKLTLTFNCIDNKTYFDSLVGNSSMLPLPNELVDEMGPEAFVTINPETMWYCGPYILTTFVANNEKVFTPNPNYWDTEAERFNSMTHKMVESNEVAYQMYENGEIDYIALNESNIQTINKDPNHKFYGKILPDDSSKFAYSIHFNYNKNHKEDGTVDTNWNKAAANEAFRKSWYYGLDLTGYYSRINPTEPMKCENTIYTRTELVWCSDGTDYADLVKSRLGIKENGQTMTRLDANKAAEYKKQAMEELTALGVTFPVEIDYFIPSGNQSELDSALVLKDAFKQCLGEDYVTFNIDTYVSAVNTEVRQPRIQSFMINGWGADYMDPENYLTQVAYQTDGAWYAKNFSNINTVEEDESNKQLLEYYRTYTDLLRKGDAINENLDERYNALADAEAYLLEHCLIIPCKYQSTFCLSNIDMFSKKMTSRNLKMKTNSEGYTYEQHMESEKEYLALKEAAYNK